MVRKLVIFAAALCLAVLMAAQQTMNNAAVLKLAKAGLSDELIVATINASPGAYNTSADALIALKSAGVSDKVVAAIVVKAASPAASRPAAPPEFAPIAPPPAPADQPSATLFHSTDGKLRVYVTDHPVVEVNELGTASGNQSAAAVAEAAHAPITDPSGAVEVVNDLVKECSENVIPSDNPDRADFVLVFRRHGVDRSSLLALHGLTNLALSGGAKVDGASLYQNDGDMIYTTRQISVEKAIRDLCGHIPFSAPPQSPTPAAM
jgi:hypothetical protein